MRGSPLSRGPIGRHLQQWTIHQPHRHFRPNIIAATPSGSGNSPVKLRRPRSRSIYAQWRCNMSGWPNVSITARSRRTPDGCRSGGERWAPPTSTTPRARWTRGLASQDHQEREPVPTISLKVTRAPPGAAARPTPQFDKPLFRGTGDTDYLCGNCGAVIAASMGPAQRVIIDAATCSACGAENEFPLSLRA
jgi:hypothetical protein